MDSSADWMVVAGFVLAVSGLAFRVAILMRSSDAHPANAAPLQGRDLLRSYRAANPKSGLLLVMRTAMSAGLVLLIAGFLLEFR